METIVVYVTVPKEEEAVKIARALVQERLSACVNIIPSISSIYRWEGKVEEDKELLLIIKTKRATFERLCRRVKELHSYTVPEIIALPIVEGSTDYINWLIDSVD